MAKLTQFAALAIMIVTPLIFNSCKRNDPVPEVNQEEFNRVTFTFAKLDSTGNETTEKVITTFDDLEHAHETSETEDEVHGSVALTPGSNYRLTIDFYHDHELMNQEIIDEGDVHQLFFIPASSGLIDYQYEDKDKDNRPIGLKGRLTVLNSGEVDLNVVLRHNLTKSHSAAESWNNPGYAQAGGADDLNVVLEIHAAGL